MSQEAFYFRESKGALYGSYHPPTSSVRPSAVVLCQPYGHEYVQSHRAFRLLADRLADAGFPTLRFDWRGTGDSAGGDDAVDLEAWREDLRAAAEICKARSGRRKVAAVGLRLGGSLAALEAGRAGAFDTLALWDPVVAGADYLAEVRGLEEQFRLSLPGTVSRSDANQSEALGFAYLPGFRDQLEALDLSSARVNGTRAALVLHTEHEGSTAPGLTLGCEREDHVTVRDPRIWMEDADKALIPHEALGAIVDWLTETSA